MEKQKSTKIENLFKKVQMYQREKPGKYQIPKDLQSLAKITDSELLREKIES